MKLLIYIVCIVLNACSFLSADLNKYIDEHPEIKNVRYTNSFHELCGARRRVSVEASKIPSENDLADAYVKYLVAKNNANTYKVISKVIFKNDERDKDGEVEIASCPAMAFFSLDEFISECEKNNNIACFHAGKLKMKEEGDNYTEFLAYFKKACDLKLPEGCNYYSENLKRYTELQKIQALDAKCKDNKDKQSCLDLMMIFREKKMNAQAHPYAERACYYGVQTGCEFMRAIEDSISMEAQRKSLDLQSTILVERNRLLQVQISTEKNNANAIASELSGINFKLNLLRNYGPK
jgi:hypothetical protein